MPAVRFGRFEFAPDTGVLTREGTPVRLQPQPARVLALLVARGGEVVPREDLKAAVWGDQTFVDFERGLNFCIAQIRSALGDAADSPRYVETVPRRGYRFIAPIAALPPKPVPAGGSPPGSLQPPVPPPGIPARAARSVPIAAAALLVVAFAGAFLSWQHAAGGSRTRVAVVPFDNETGVTGFDGIAGGIADATVARLATADRARRLAVIGNSAALRRPRSFRDLRAIGEEVRAEYVVLAQMKHDGSRLRLIAHLIRVSDEAHVWAQTFDRDAFTLEAQGEVAEAIAAAVAQRVIR